MLLVKNAEIYAPEYLGKKDLLICGGKIECIQDSIRELPVECEVLDAEGKILTPGFLDQHVHITGGGGEGSFHTRTPELQMSELVENGITTVVGLLGTDGITRSVDNLYAKTRVLCEFLLVFRFQAVPEFIGFICIVSVSGKDQIIFC